MADNKTAANDGDVRAYLQQVGHDTRREDSFVLLDMMGQVSGEPATMWGDSLVGFGSYHYRYDSGHEGDYFLMGFAPRKQNLSLHLMGCMIDEAPFSELLGRLGKHRMGRSCLYINRLADVDLAVLRQLMEQSMVAMHDYVATMDEKLGQ